MQWLVTRRKGAVLRSRLGGLEAVSVTTQPTFAFGNALPMASPFQPKSPNSRTSYGITPGGKFVVPVTAEQTEFSTPTAPQIQVVLNWLEELKRLVPR